MEFNPIDKVSDLMELFKAYRPILHPDTEEGYDWLDENSFCIEIPNLNTEDSITIACEDDWEFTVCYSYFHAHYFADEYGYDRMCEAVFDLLHNKSATATIFCKSENKWMGSRLIEREKITLPIEEIFDFVFEHKAFAEALRAQGGEARFDFWDSSLNQIITF